MYWQSFLTYSALAAFVALVAWTTMVVSFNVENQTQFIPFHWNSTYLYGTGIAMIAVIGVSLLSKYFFGTDAEEQTHVKRLNSFSRSNGQASKSNDVTTKYPQVYITATRPASVNVKPMLRLSNEIQSFVDRIEQYSDNLETILSDRTAEFTRCRQQLDGLLRELLPPSIAQQFSAGDRVPPAAFECATVYYSDIVGYTTIVAQSSAVEMVEFLNSLYRMTDVTVASYDAFKVETIGDADLIASGIPVPNGNKHASELAKLSLHMLRDFANFRIPHRPNESLQIRIGLHSGLCMAGIVGSRIPKYILFGDAVSTATKLESSSQPGKIQISTTTADLLTEIGGFDLERRGFIELKASKKMETFWLKGLQE